MSIGPVIPPPPGFPSGIEVVAEQYLNWCWAIDVQNVWTCTPVTANDVVSVCNWAVGAGFRVRARGIMHGWSPLTIDPATAPFANVMLIDTTQNLTAMSFVPRSGGAAPRVTVGTGATMEALLEFLEQQPGGAGAAPGFGFPHVPAPGHLTVGGVLAIDAHGSAVPNALEGFPASYGSLSNQILAFTAVVTDPASPTPDAYTLRTFTRGEGDDAAFLTHLGRAFLVDVTLQVIDNYNLRCQSFTNVANATLFAQPPSPGTSPPQSVGAYLAESGRVEVICYPFTETCWLKVWTNTPQKPPSSTAVTSPYNYGFSDHLPDFVTTLFKEITEGAGWLTPLLGRTMQFITTLGLTTLGDLWGPSKNVLLYIRDATLRVTANGYAVHLKRENVQQAIYDFTTKYAALLSAYQNDGKFPVNAPLEIRVTALDDPKDVAAPGARPPVISALSPDATDTSNGWDTAVWFDVLTLPGTPLSDQFYADLEAWVTQNFSGTYAKALPEWSKGWAYTATGPWTSDAYLTTIRDTFTTGRSGNDTWDWEVATLQKYDAKSLFWNPLLERLFVPV